MDEFETAAAEWLKRDAWLLGDAVSLALGGVPDTKQPIWQRSAFPGGGAAERLFEAAADAIFAAELPTASLASVELFEPALQDNRLLAMHVRTPILRELIHTESVPLPARAYVDPKVFLRWAQSVDDLELPRVLRDHLRPEAKTRPAHAEAFASKRLDALQAALAVICHDGLDDYLKASKELNAESLFNAINAEASRLWPDRGAPPVAMSTFSEVIRQVRRLQKSLGGSGGP